MEEILEELKVHIKNNENFEKGIESISKNKFLVAALVAYYLTQNDKSFTHE